MSEEEFEWHEVKSEYKKKEEEANDDVQRKMYVSTGMHEKSTMGVKFLKIKGWLIGFGMALKSWILKIFCLSQKITKKEILSNSLKVKASVDASNHYFGYLSSPQDTQWIFNLNMNPIKPKSNRISIDFQLIFSNVSKQIYLQTIFQQTFAWGGLKILKRF